MADAYYYSSTAGAMVLTAGITGSASGLTVDTTVGLPGSVPFKLTLDPGLSREEIVKVTQVAGLTLTVVRGQDGTAGQPHDNGSQVRHMFTAEDARLSRQHESATSNVHGVVSALVGVNDSQVLTNKTINGTTNTITNVQKTALPNDVAYKTGDQTFVGGSVFIGDAADPTSRVFWIKKKAQTGTNTYDAKFYLDASNGVSKLTHVLVENGVEKARSSLANDGTFTNNGPIVANGGDVIAKGEASDVVAATGDVVLGDGTNATQRTLHVYRKATTGTKTYEMQVYLGDPGDGTLAPVTRLIENGVEKGRTTQFADGSFSVSGDLKVAGKVTASNVGGDTGWIATGFGVGAGWSQSTSQYRTVNGVTTLNFRFTRTGANIVVPANGGVADDNVISIPTAIRSGFVVSVSGIVNINNGGSCGWMGRIEAGTLYIMTSANPNVTWTTGSSFYGTITYIV